MSRAHVGADRDHLGEMKALGVRCGQLGIPGSMELTETAAADWKNAIDEQDFAIVTVFAAYNGETYSDIPTVQRTVGFIPRESREEREHRTYAVSDFAAALGVGSIACHIGFVPEDHADPDRAAVRDLVRRICDHAERHGQTFALETGQEPAGTRQIAFPYDKLTARNRTGNGSKPGVEGNLCLHPGDVVLVP